MTTTKTPARRRRGGRGRSRANPPAEPLPAPSFEEQPAFERPLESEPSRESEPIEPVPAIDPEPLFAARVPPPEPERPRPTIRRAIFFDVENSSRADHVARVLAHLAIDRIASATELYAVGNWRVVNHDTARLLAQRGANLVHSAPSVGVRDWSDLRIAVAAGCWLAQARSGDLIEIISDDQAFDAVGDVASSLGVAFRRLSFRALAGAGVEPLPEEVRTEPPSHRRRRGGRRGRRSGGGGTRAPALPVAARPVVSNGSEPEDEGHTAPHDELLAVARELLGAAPTISIDMLSNALKAHGFRRTPGSPRLITRLRRIKELDVSRTGAIRLLEGEAPEAREVPETAVAIAGDEAETPPVAGDPGATPVPGKRRRRRRGGRRRRGRGGGGQTVVASP